MAAKDHPKIGGFPSTRWALISSARAEDALRRRAALDELWRLYLPALRAHILYRLRIEPHRAEDLLQAFVTRQVLERDLLAKADEARGRFRSFLLKSFRNFVFSELGAAGRKELALDLEPLGLEPLDSPACDVFEVQWARQLLQEALRRMKRECADDGTAARWDLFACRVLLPTLAGSPSPAYETLVARFGFRSPEQASNALVTAKRHFERTLRAVIAETEDTTDDAEIAAEIADLRATLQKAGDLGLNWDRAVIAGSQGQGSERVTAVDESNPSELACLLSVQGTPEGNWQPAELGELLRHCLAAPVSEYLRDSGQPVEFAADSPSECAAVDMTLGELLQRADAPLGLLIAVKRHARRLMNPGASAMPVEVHQLVYFASIAAALVRHGERISKSSPEVLRAAWGQIAAELYTEEWLRRLFATARERLANP